MGERARCSARLLIAMLLLILSLPRPAAGAEPTGTLFLQIKTEAGGLVPHAAVHVNGTAGETGWGWADFPNGQQTMWLTPGTYKISVSAVGYEPAEDQTVTVKANQNQSVTFVLRNTVAPGSITGKIIDKNSGSAMARVSVGLLRNGQAVGAPVKTDGAGSVTFAAVTPGTYTVSTGNPLLSGLWGGEFTADSQTVTVVPGAESNVTLKVLRKGRIEATVRTPDGQTAPNATVWLDSVADGAPRAITRLRQDASALGTVHLDPGKYTVTAGGAAYAKSPSQTVTVTPGQTVNISLTVEPVPSGTVRGSVRNSAGVPVTGGTVTLTDKDGNEIGKGVELGADGTFVYQSVAVGTYQVDVWAPGYSAAETSLVRSERYPIATVNVVSGQLSTIDLVLKRQVQLKVRVLGPDGRVLADASLWSGDTRLHTETDGEGNLLGSVEEGEQTLTAHSPGYAWSAAQTIRIGPAGDPPTLTFTLTRQPGGNVRGRTVAQGTGKPLPNVHVELRMIGGVLRAAPPVKSGPDGTFAFADVPPGQYELYGWGDESRVGPVLVTVKQGTVARPTLNMPAMGTLEVRVVDQKGEPIPYASVMTSQVGGGQWYMSTNKAGEALQSLGVGSYRVTARTSEHRVLAAQVVQVEHRKATEVVLTMEPAETGTVSVRVTDAATGAGVYGALVRLTDPAAPDSVDELVRTDGAGDVRFFDIPVGEYDLSVDGSAARPVRVKVTAGATAEVMLKGDK